MALDPATRKQVLRLIPYGVYVVGAAHEGHCLAFTGTFCTQCSFEPPLVALGVKGDSRALVMIEASQVFSLNWVPKDQGQDWAARFFKAPEAEGQTLAGLPFVTAETGAPLLNDALAWAEFRVRAIHRDADHPLVVGELVHVSLKRSEAPLILSDTPWKYGGLDGRELGPRRTPAPLCLCGPDL